MQKYPFIFSDAPGYRLQRHLIFWFLWWLCQGLLYAFSIAFNQYGYFERIVIALVDALGFMPCHIFLSYGLMYFVIPRYIIRHKYLAAVWWVLMLFSLTALMSAYLSRYAISALRYFFLPARMAFPYHPYAPTLFFSLLAGFRGSITIGGLAAAIKLMKHWYVKEQRNLQLQKENAEAGLQLLKAQVHPHFLFNTLNNIYANTQNVSPVASKMITGLSDILRYTLQEGNKPLVPLEQELQMIQDYISLEKIRYGNRLQLHIQLPENTNGLYIVPLLLLPLIENCFKHGTSHVLDQPWIHLHISIAENQMQMKLLNGKAIKVQEQKSTGIGLKNVQKRLSLLYPEKHELTITNEEEVFIVNLKMELILKKEAIKKENKPGVLKYA
jgi:sensor histidine kinase YesM